MSNSRPTPTQLTFLSTTIPGHIKKNFQKSLMAIYGTGVRYKGLAERGGQRMQSIANGLIRGGARSLSCGVEPVMCSYNFGTDMFVLQL